MSPLSTFARLLLLTHILPVSGSTYNTRRRQIPSVTVAGYQTKYEITEPAGDDVKQTVKKGSIVTVHATGMSSTTPKDERSFKKFWSTKDEGQRPFTYNAGTGGVITGWDQGLLGAKLGEKRMLTIPSEEGYGARGFPSWGIQGGSTLKFELEVLRIEGGGTDDEL